MSSAGAPMPDDKHRRLERVWQAVVLLHDEAFQRGKWRAEQCGKQEEACVGKASEGNAAMLEKGAQKRIQIGAHQRVF